MESQDARTCALYLRISQDRIGAGLGIARQEEDCRALAERLDWEVVAVHADNDITASTGRRRPGYEALLLDITEGQVDAVVTWHSDRLHRNPRELERYIALCEHRNVPTYTVRAGVLDLSTASGRMTARITGAVARHESEQKGERLKRQRAQAQADGKWHGGRRPFGFLADGYTHHPEEAPAIAAAVRDILSGASVRSIARAWNERGLLTSTGKPWTGNLLPQMLRRPRNAGLVGNKGRIVGPARWEPVVDRETWEALVALLDDPSRLTHRGVSLRLVGSFLYRCECGELVRSGGQRADGRDRYACPANHLSRVAEPVDLLVEQVVADLLVRDNIQLIAPTVDLAPLRAQLDVLRARAGEIAAMFGDPESGMSGTQFKVANKRLQGQIKSIERDIARKSSGSALAGVADAEDPAATFHRLHIDRKRKVIDAIATVTLLRQGPGRFQGGGYFDHRSVVIAPRWGPAPPE